MTTPENTPFRDDEAEVHLAALREQRDALAAQRDARLAELRHRRRWRWGPFLLACFATAVGAPLLLFTLLAVLAPR